MTVADTRTLLSELDEIGISLWLDGDKLRFRAPEGAMTPALREAVKANRDELIELLRVDAGSTTVAADPKAAFEPFPLTDIQASYLLGRGSAFRFGGVGCHGYGELAFDELDPGTVQRAWNRLITRHAMLRTVVDSSSAQRVLETVDEYVVAFTDLRGRDAAAVEAGRAEVRGAMDHRVYEPAQWPMFDLRLTADDGEWVLHLSVDFLIADFVSLQILLDELSVLLADPDADLPVIGVEFRDHVISERAGRERAAHETARQYWLQRLDTLPGAPDLPLRADAEKSPPRFERWQTRVVPEQWSRITALAAEHGVSASTAVLTAFADTIAAWSAGPAFTLNLTLLNRDPVHPDINAVVGDFTSVDLLEVAHRPDDTLAARATALQTQLWSDLDNRAFNGVEVLRELARRRGGAESLMPVVFTSAIGLDAADRSRASQPGRIGAGISQTPQVWVDCQNLELDGGLNTNWDVRVGVLPDGVVDDMFAAFTAALDALTDPAGWTATGGVAPPADQLDARAEANGVTAPVTDLLLHDRIGERARTEPDAIAVLDAAGQVWRYGRLWDAAGAVTAALLEAGVAPGEHVAVVMERGWEQIVAVLGILRAGAVYAPVDALQPSARREHMLSAAGVRVALVQSWAPQPLPETVRALEVDVLAQSSDTVVPDVRRDPDDPAYVIFTSGSTGVPKGVVISHRGAVNTLLDLERRYGVTAADRVLALSNLGFDLSVFDVFSLLAVGGSIVVPDPAQRANPSHWADLCTRYGVTLWNTVPALSQMLVDYLDLAGGAPTTLRVMLMSGDWIPTDLPARLAAHLPGCHLVSLGGATEVSIWSVAHDIDDAHDDWPSVPYGRPLTNQTMHVLDAELRPRPDWVAGELFIGGVGVALEYLGDADRTAEKFLVSPITGERLYRTGDLARWRPGAVLEFLGRRDDQVKIRGHRIELAEIEAAARTDETVVDAVAIAHGPTAADRRLALFVQPAGGQDSAADDPELDPAVTTAVGSVARGVDPQAYDRYMEDLDAAGVVTIRHTLAELDVPVDGTPEQVTAAAERAGVLPRHLRLVRRWCRLVAELDSAGAAGSGATPGTVADARVAAAQFGESPDLLDYFERSSAGLSDLLRGTVDPLTLLFPQGSLDVAIGLYEQALFNRWANVAVGAVVSQYSRAATTAGRTLRVLEVGAGAGGTSEYVVDALGFSDEFVCTDLSAFFVQHATDRLAHAPSATFHTLDLNHDLGPQGVAPNSVDMVVAGDVLHATLDLPRTLQRVREVLRPGGVLVSVEMTRDHAQILSSLELLVALDPDTHDFLDERRGTDKTFLPADEWDTLLAAAGGRLVADFGADDPLVAAAGIRVAVHSFKDGVATVDTDALTQLLRGALPEYMVPATVQVVDAVPLSANGKVDRAALTAQLTAPTAAGPGSVDPVQSPLEQAVADVWCTVLGLPAVGRSTNFFEAGGDSLLAARVAGTLAETLPELGVTRFFDELLQLVLEVPTVSEFCARLGVDDVAAASDSGGDTGDGLLVLGGEAGADQLVVVAGAQLPEAIAHSVTGQFHVLGTSAVPVPSDAAAIAPLLDRWAAQVTAAGTAVASVLGVGVAGQLAVALARRLLEAGVVVEEVTVVGARPAVVPAEPAVADYLWACDRGLDLAALGAPTREQFAADPAALAASGWAAQADDARTAALAGADPELDAAGVTAAVATFAAVQQALADDVGLYAGDVRLVVSPVLGLPVLADDAELWIDQVLGDVEVVTADDAFAPDPSELAR